MEWSLASGPYDFWRRLPEIPDESGGSRHALRDLNPSRPRKLPLLEALLAKHRATLRWTEGYCRFLPARRALGRRFDPVPCRRWPGTDPVGSLSLARLAPLRLVFELLIGEEQLFACSPNEIRAAIHAPQGLVLELHRSPPRARRSRDRSLLLRLATEFLTVPLARQSLFCPALVTRLQVERMLLDVLDDVFLLNLALEAAECTLDRLAFLNLDFSHA